MTLNDCLFAFGLAVMVTGVALIFVPAALIVAGLAMAGTAYRLDA
jgi:hypothetical protein